MSSETHNVSDPTPAVQTTSVNGVTFTQGHEPTLLHWGEPLGVLITTEEWWAMTADDLRAAIRRDLRGVFRYPNGTYSLWDTTYDLWDPECDEYEIVPQNAHDSPSAPRGCVRSSAPPPDAPELQERGAR